MFSKIKKIAGVSVVAALLVGAMDTAAQASAAEVSAFTLYTNAVAADSLASAADTSASVGDNITCDPAAVVTGTGANPRVQYVVGEVYATVVMAAHWKCASLDTGVAYTISGTATDMYYSAGAYRAGGVATDAMGDVYGAGTVNPARTITYAGGHAAINTWHYVRFVGTTSTGRRIITNSQLFYVSGV